MGIPICLIIAPPAWVWGTFYRNSLSGFLADSNMIRMLGLSFIPVDFGQKVVCWPPIIFFWY